MKLAIKLIDDKDKGWVKSGPGGWVHVFADRQNPDVLAHELGHVVDLLYNPHEYASAKFCYFWFGTKSNEVVAAEARAWRYALKIKPDIDRKFLRKMFGTYVSD